MKVKNLFQSYCSNEVSEYTYFATDDLWDNVSGDVRIEGNLTNYEQRIHAFIESKEEFGRESLEISATFVLVADTAYITSIEGQFTGILDYISSFASSTSSLYMKQGLSRNRFELTLDTFTSNENYLQMEALDLLENALSMKRNQKTRFVIFDQDNEKMYNTMYEHFKRFHEQQIEAVGIESMLPKDIVDLIINYALIGSR